MIFTLFKALVEYTVFGSTQKWQEAISVLKMPFTEYPKSQFSEINHQDNDGTWKIYRRKSDDWLFLEPNATSHEYSLIFIHGLGGSSFQMLEEFLPYNETKLVPKNTRVILPHSPKNV